MAFADIASKDGLLLVYRADVSLDKWATIAYRWSSHADVDAANDYDPRIIRVGRIDRALGVDHAISAATTELELANDDAGVDWLLTPNSGDALKVSVRLYVGAAVLPFGGAATIQWQQLGEYVVNDSPTMTTDRIVLTLDDNSQAALDATLSLPTFREWALADTDYCPLNTVAQAEVKGDPEYVDMSLPVQLAFGDDYVRCVKLTSRKIPFYDGEVLQTFTAATFAICSTTGSGGPDNITEVVVKLKNGTILTLPQYSPTPGEIFPRVTVWEARSSFNPVVKDGRSWNISWLSVSVVGFARYTDNYNKPTSIAAATAHAGQAAPTVDDIEMLWVRAYPLSARTHTSDATQNAWDVITDLVTYYSDGALSLHSDSFDRARSVCLPSCAGTIGASDGAVANIGKTIGEIGGSADADLFMRADGLLGVSILWRDFTALAATLPAFDEERIAEFEQAIAPRGARWAPFNKAVLRDIRTRPFDDFQSQQFGPERAVSNPSPGTDLGRTVEGALSCRWMPSWLARSMDPWRARNIETAVRPVIQFITTLAALTLELGDQFALTWTRNLGGPYSGARFQVDALSFEPASGTVQVTAVWLDDLASVRPFIVDDESYLTRVSASGGRTATVQNSVATVTFNSGSLATDGVAAGDHLILKDATEAGTSFKRNRAIRIVSVDSATQLTVDNADLDFGTAGALAVAAWEIRRSHLTYPTVVSDPTHYPASTASVYGRVASDSDLYSSAGTGGFTATHQLLDG